MEIFKDFIFIQAYYDEFQKQKTFDIKGVFYLLRYQYLPKVITVQNDSH